MSSLFCVLLDLLKKIQNAPSVYETETGNYDELQRDMNALLPFKFKQKKAKHLKEFSLKDKPAVILHTSYFVQTQSRSECVS